MLYTQVLEKSLLPPPLQCSVTSENLGEGIITQVLKVGEKLRSERQRALNSTGVGRGHWPISTERVISY